jgi:[protein-PII] uridylyltransferase
LQVTVYLRDQPDLFARICSYFDRKNFSILDAKIHTTRDGYALDTFLVSEPNFADNYRELITLIEHDLTHWLQTSAVLPPPAKARLSRLSRSFPITPTLQLRPDERGQYYLLSISASDRTGLLYSIASVLARYKVNLHTAKITTLGERVEDVFLVDGPVLSHARSQIAFESDLLDALRV